jgi:hypothetical protein
VGRTPSLRKKFGDFHLELGTLLAIKKMNKEEYKDIKTLEYVDAFGNPQSYSASKGCSFECVMESGEMSGIAWIAIFIEGKKVAQIKQSVCNIYF